MGSPSNLGALHFASIRLKNWRNFLDIYVPLQQRVFLVGPNASGKFKRRLSSIEEVSPDCAAYLPDESRTS